MRHKCAYIVGFDFLAFDNIDIERRLFYGYLDEHE